MLAVIVVQPVMYCLWQQPLQKVLWQRLRSPSSSSLPLQQIICVWLVMWIDQMKEPSLGQAGDAAHNCWHLSWRGDPSENYCTGRWHQKQIRAHTLQESAHHRANPLPTSLHQRGTHTFKYFKYILWICCKHNLKQPCKFLLNWGNNPQVNGMCVY